VSEFNLGLTNELLYVFLLLILIFPNLAISSQKNSDWGGVCNFANKSITFNFRSISGDATNDDMIFSIDAKVVDLPNAWFYPSYTYVQGIKNLCSGGIIAFKKTGMGRPYMSDFTPRKNNTDIHTLNNVWFSASIVEFDLIGMEEQA
jgi:hypothetical protein